MPDRPDLSVVVPVYRNAETLEPLTDQVTAVTASLGLTPEIVFVVDASPDDSLARAVDLSARRRGVVVVDLPRNVGQHAAVLHGLARARGAACVVMDADLQDRPESLVTLWRARRPGLSAVFGGRTGRYQPRGRHLSSQAFKWLLHQLTGVPADAGLFVLLERDLVEALVAFPTRVPCIQAMIGCLAVPVVSVPVTRDVRRTGASSYGTAKRVLAGVRGVACVIEYRVWRPRRTYLAATTAVARARL